MRRRAGFSLAEVIIAMTLLAIVMSSLATLAYTVSERGKDNEVFAKRTFALQHEANRYGVMSFADLALQTNGATEVLLGDFLFTRTLTITAVDSTRYTVKIVIQPVYDPTRRDSVIFDRTKAMTGTPLCTIC